MTSTQTSRDASTGAQGLLIEHNAVRTLRPLVWSDDLDSKAALWASGCKMEHSGGALGRLGAIFMKRFKLGLPDVGFFPQTTWRLILEVLTRLKVP